MIGFNELYITKDSSQLFIDVSVLDLDYYKDVYIDSIVIDNQDTYLSTGPSSTPVYTYTVPEGTNKKHLRLELCRIDLLGGLDNLLFVYVRVKGAPKVDTPCGYDNITTMGSVINTYPLYQTAMNYIGELANNCSTPKSFIDWILRLKAIELAIKTGHYPEAIKYYNKFFKNMKNTVIKKGGCNCGAS